MSNSPEVIAPSVLLQTRQLQARIPQIAKEIDKHYQGEEIVLLVILKGALVFAADLMRELRTPFRLEFSRAQSYGNGQTSEGLSRLELPDVDTIRDKHVLVVDDILDTGVTYTSLKEALLDREALSVRGCFLLDKSARRSQPVRADFFGFEIPDVFVVGYGMDLAEKYRQLPWVGQLNS